MSVSRMNDGGMRIGRGNRSNRRRPAPVPLYPPDIQHDLAWDRTRVAAVEVRFVITHGNFIAGFEVDVTMNMSTIFLDVTPCNPVEVR
jgi:hypothetical protein